MSGTRYSSFREGDRSEYLATYFLSAIGLVTPVPRQEDIGFDLVCSIADQETGPLSFNHQYLVSVKSLSAPIVDLEPANSKDETLPHISWLFRQELPLLLAVVDKKAQEVRVFSTLPIWFVYFENPDRESLSLVPRMTNEDTSDVGKPIKGAEVPSLPGRYHYTVDLGHPVLRATVNSLSDSNELKKFKERLRFVVSFGRATARQVQLGVPYFYWFKKTYSDGSCPAPAFYAGQLPDAQEAQDFVWTRIGPTLISLALLFRSKDDRKNLDAVVQLLRSVPQDYIPPEVREQIPELQNG
jgi:hypothetical protein